MLPDGRTVALRIKPVGWRWAGLSRYFDSATQWGGHWLGRLGSLAGKINAGRADHTDNELLVTLRRAWDADDGLSGFAGVGPSWHWRSPV